MEAFDSSKVLRVWQRVRSAPESEVPDPRALAEEELTDAAALAALARRFTGNRRKGLEALAKQAQSHGAQLKGILALTQENAPEIRSGSLGLTQTESLLRRCGDRMHRRGVLYRSLESDPRFGRTYAALAAEEEAGSRLLLELLGSMPRPGIPRRNGPPQPRRR